MYIKREREREREIKFFGFVLVLSFWFGVSKESEKVSSSKKCSFWR